MTWNHCASPSGNSMHCRSKSKTRSRGQPDSSHAPTAPTILVAHPRRPAGSNRNRNRRGKASKGSVPAKASSQLRMDRPRPVNKVSNRVRDKVRAQASNRANNLNRVKDRDKASSPDNRLSRINKARVKDNNPGKAASRGRTEKVRDSNQASRDNKVSSKRRLKAREKVKAKAKGSPNRKVSNSNRRNQGRDKGRVRERDKDKGRDKDSNRLNKRSKVRGRDRDVRVVRLRRAKISNSARSCRRPISRLSALPRERRTPDPDRAVNALAISIRESSLIQIRPGRKAVAARHQTAPSRERIIPNGPIACATWRK